jgi:TRAP-type uncharacterized transport system substrate-binding protein
MSLSDTASSFSEVLSRRLKIRHIALLLALSTTMLLYYSAVNRLDPDHNFLLNIGRRFTSSRFVFYSGSSGGFYIEIGKNLEDRSKREPSLDIINQGTNGGQDNLELVAASTSAMGLCQLDTLHAPSNESLKERVKEVVPLYAERMHILYNAEQWELFREGWARDNRKVKLVTGKGARRLTLFPEDDNTPEAQVARAFLSTVPVSIGKPGSGTHKFATALRNASGFTGNVERGFGDAFRELTSPNWEKGDVAVVFTIAGAPLPEVKKFLESRRLIEDDASPSPRVALASIDTGLVQQLITANAFKIKSSDFYQLYEDVDQVFTFSSDAWMIASKEVPNSSILTSLDLLARARADIRSQLGIRAGQPFQLESTSFYEVFKSEHDRQFLDSLREFVIFIFTMISGTAIGLTFFVWLNSSSRKIRFLRTLESIAQNSVPDNSRLMEGETVLPMPVIFKDQTTIVSKVVRGMANLIGVAVQVHAEHGAGSITVKHYEHLSARINSLKELLQRNLGRRLNEHIAGGQKFDPELLRHYRTAGYLNADDYAALTQQLPGS